VNELVKRGVEPHLLDEVQDYGGEIRGKIRDDVF